MASQPFRYRTIFEIAAISIILYIFLGFPGLAGKEVVQDDSSRVVPSQAKIGKLVYPSMNLQCPRHEYTVNIFSTAPLVIHIDGFLGEAEADHLIQLRYISDPSFNKPSLTTNLAQTNGTSPQSPTKASKA